jgi:hypothetical protein
MHAASHEGLSAGRLLFARTMRAAAEALRKLHRDPALARAGLRVPDSTRPPTEQELAQAADVIERAVACLLQSSAHGGTS